MPIKKRKTLYLYFSFEKSTMKYKVKYAAHLYS